MIRIILILLLWASPALADPKNYLPQSETPVAARCVTADGLSYESCGGSLTLNGADGAINDGANDTIKATVKDYTNSNPLTTIIVDTNGDPASIGGGTQYNQGTASTTTDTMTMAGCVRVDTPAVAAGVIDGDRARCMVDSTGRLWVHVGVIDGTVAVTQSGTWNIATLTSITNPVAVTGTFWQATQPVSGTVTVTDGAGALNVIVDSGTTAATQSGTWTVQPGNTANTTPWLATINQGGNSATVNGSGQLAVNCANCSGSGVSQQDNTGFTPGTTNFVPMGGEVDDTGTTAVTENNAGVARITAQRAVHMNLRNNSGTEIGTSGNPVRTDPTGSTTQPVSGTVSISGTVTVSDGSGALNVICDSGCSGGTQYDEDTAHVSGDKLTLAGVVRSDAAAALAADGDRTVLQVDSNGYLKVVNINPNLAADNSTLSTSKVPVLPGTVSTSAPTWTNGNQSALSLQTDGSVRSAVTNTVTVTASNLDVQIGGSDSLTIGTFPDNEPFNIAQMNGVTVSMGVGASGTGTQRVASLIHDGTDTAQVTATAGGSLQVECTSGCGGSGGTSIADDAAFTPGTTSVTPAGAMFDDVTPDSVNEGDAGVVRMSANRNLYTTLRDAAGNERGANVNASGELQVAITANSAVNVAQINGVTPLMGAGNTGTGVQRVIEATDSQLSAGVGATGDAAATAGGTGSMNAKQRLMTSQLDSIKTAVETIDNIVSGSGANISQMGGAAVSMGNGASGTGVQRVTIANDSTGVLATVNSLTQMNGQTIAMGTGTRSAGTQRVTVATDDVVPASQSGTWTVQPGNTANTTPWLTSSIPATSGGTSVCYITSAASTNSTNCKASAGQLYGFDLVNTTATVYYLRLYNSSSAPTCSSATGFVRTIPIPASTTGAGIARSIPVGEAYGTGIGFCLTGGGSSTDNTNAATGVYVTLNYK